MRAEIETLRHQLDDSKNELALEREKRKSAENNVEDLARQLRRIEEELETRVKELKEENERRVRKEHEAEEVKRANYY